MTKEDKKLLLTDLSARLTYPTLCYCKWAEIAQNNTRGCIQKISTFLLDELMIMDNPIYECQICEIKPYLRSMSSMTEKEENAYRRTWYNPLFDSATRQHTREEYLMLLAKAQHNSIMFLLENHFDYLGLIPKGMAIEVTKENNPYKV